MAYNLAFHRRRRRREVLVGRALDCDWRRRRDEREDVVAPHHQHSTDQDRIIST